MTLSPSDERGLAHLSLDSRLRRTFLELPPFDHMHRFLPALVRAAGGGIIAMPVSHRPRKAGRSKYGIGNRLWVGIVDLLGVRWLIKRQVAPHAGREETE